MGLWVRLIFLNYFLWMFEFLFVVCLFWLCWECVLWYGRFLEIWFCFLVRVVKLLGEWFGNVCICLWCWMLIGGGLFWRYLVLLVWWWFYLRGWSVGEWIVVWFFLWCCLVLLVCVLLIVDKYFFFFYWMLLYVICLWWRLVGGCEYWEVGWYVVW